MEIAENINIENSYKDLESVEKKAWNDFYKSASPGTVENLGLKFKSFSSAVASIADSADILAMNRVIGFESKKDLNDKNLKEIIHEYEKNSIPRFFLQIRPDLLDEENTARLNLSGFTFYNNWVKLYRNNSPVKNIDSGIVVEQIGKQGGHVFAEIVLKSFEWNNRLSKWFFDFVQRDRWIHYLGYFQHRPAAAASMYMSGEYAWLGFAATLKEFRKLGAQHALIRQRLQDGLNSGCKHFIVETAENTPGKKSQSFMNLKDMGFEQVYKRPNYIYISQKKNGHH